MEYNNVIIMGDFNIRLDNTKDPDVTAFMDTMSALGLDQQCKLFNTQVWRNSRSHLY